MFRFQSHLIIRDAFVTDPFEERKLFFKFNFPLQNYMVTPQKYVMVLDADIHATLLPACGIWGFKRFDCVEKDSVGLSQTFI